MLKNSLGASLKKDDWVKPYLKRYRETLCLAISLGFLTFFCGSALMFNSGYLISKAATQPENILLIYVPIVLTRAFGIGRPAFRYVERLTSHNWVLKMTSNLRLRLYRVIEKEAIFVRQKFKSGDILGLLAEDINHIQNLYLRTIFPTITAWLLYTVIVIALGFFSIWFAAVMALLLGIIVFVLPLWSVLVNGARIEQQKVQKKELYSTLTDNILGVSDWIFADRGEDYVALYTNKEAQLINTTHKIERFNRKRNFLVQWIFGWIVLVLLLFTGTRFVGNYDSANWIAAFVLSVFPLIDAFAPLSIAAEETTSYKESIDRFNDLPKLTDDKESYPELDGEITIAVKDVSFHYSNTAQDVLKKLTLTIPAREKLAILGRSGSGKSTLATLLRGDLKPTHGDIFLNDLAVSELGDSVHRYIGVLSQTPYLFNTTILNNIRIGNENASKADVWTALQQVGLKDLITSLPQGLETMVDEAGKRFSGGERQRLALARLLIHDVPIILLDEPTVGLDPITEQALIDTIFKTLADKTIIWITHHLQGIDVMDKVVFLEDGTLEMSGTPSELLQKNTHYQRLIAIDKGL